MLLCEFCTEFEKGGECRLGLRIPKRMSCREFAPGVEQFCANPCDFVSEKQLAGMATYFDIKGSELRKIRIVATRELERRSANDPRGFSAGDASIGQKEI